MTRRSNRLIVPGCSWPSSRVATPVDRTTSVGATNACRLELDYTVNWTAS